VPGWEVGEPRNMVQNRLLQKWGKRRESKPRPAPLVKRIVWKQNTKRNRKNGDNHGKKSRKKPKAKI